MKCRKNVKHLSTDEKDRFINAFLALKTQDSVIHPGSQSRYDDFVETHLLAMHDPTTHQERPLSWGHGGSIFLPWHRELLYQFEQLLQSVDSTVTIPYWDWTRAQATGDAGYPFTHDFLGVDGTDADNDRVKKEPGAPSPYPYEFDPEAWSTTIQVIDHMDTLDFFQRQFGEFNAAGTVNDAPDLPENDVNVTGTNTNFRAAINSANDYLTLRARSEDLHNLVHRYVGGNMLRMTSPNDPIFFLHHAQIDRMWSIWQKKVPAGTDLYVVSNNVNGHRLNDAMIFNDIYPAPFTLGATPAQMINGHAMHGVGVWYDSDIPEIDTPSPSLDFIGIPEGLTSFKAVKFKIKGGRKVKFRITGDPTGQFGLTPMMRDFEATPVDADDFFYGYVWVRLTAVPGPIANSSVQIHAYITDEEGYYAATENGEYPLGDYTVTLTATTVPRENNSVALVLDRSGSMAAAAGGTSTRSQLLGNAIEVFRTLMLPNDEVAVVTFDDVVASPIMMQAVSGAPSFSTVDISPRNETWIGGGIQAGAVQLAAATHGNRSMIVLTDGNENVHPYIAELPGGTVTTRTYAIGFGLPGDVSDAALNQITSNTNGDLIITGNMTSPEQQFNLTKYFVQVLAGVTNSQVILDPNGKLYFGSKDVVPFKVTEADVYVDAIALCPIPAYLDFTLITPGGQVITPASAGANVQYIQGQQVLCYRMVLPALPANASGTHAGTWNAVITLKDPKDIDRLRKDRTFAAAAVSPNQSGFLPYSFLVHTTSNLQFEAWRVQNSLKPGARILLLAKLKEYDVIMKKPASVWADVTTPDLAELTVKLEMNANGIYEASFATTLPGLYNFRVRAEGNTSKGMPFTREKTLTAGVYYGNYDPVPQPDPKDILCKLLHCLAEKGGDVKGFDAKALLECMKDTCRKPKEHRPVKNVKPQAIAEVTIVKANESKAVKMEPKTPPAVDIRKERKPAFKTMFNRLDIEPSPETHGGQHKKKAPDTPFRALDLDKEEKKGRENKPNKK